MTAKTRRHLTLKFIAKTLQTRASKSPSPPLIRFRHNLNRAYRTSATMLFFSFFKTLVDHEVTIELKNDLSIRGTLKSVDQFLNIKLDEIQVVDEVKYPHLSAVKNVFIRGSVVRYVHLPANAVDTALLEDATRREAAAQANKAK
ncbi:U6 snRNA-associated Sm-like protein LSm2 [Orbilia oligospora]|uniref:Sm domain-containing protein n=5 Tax=Orbiliaceae TaxID=47021 RepID=G1X4L9_ARTOA|nr:hypothetical protein AOL_s00043g643 [Orbilia oligospora ATCC 24927]KAF3081941.1 U6 snRNA-associated Sm-like protein LSm2 [Orbilia oligospora]EGX51909.1 hypothetical protein AOL_s00043g643 [Orbilia oligospora ATCC 24927]KAF3091010.1 U6 snRNA-associated Sm-like protein LSm2 [Orbilia oligospora]KAF3097822.1 U6 snRNA-associated Sm-like protein LSm2 [Orbilia oligospora]KAF3131446.1 U6 snRNA-associated Sm-like protein LSm2 [Orbilia oligospora]